VHVELYLVKGNGSYYFGDLGIDGKVKIMWFLSSRV